VSTVSGPGDDVAGRVGLMFRVFHHQVGPSNHRELITFPLICLSCAVADVVAMRATHRNEMVTRNSQSMTRSGAFLKKRGLLRCRVQEKHCRWRERSRLFFLPNFNSTDLNSSKVPLEFFQTRCQLTRVVDDRDILSRSARICVAVTIASL
jgi:hypothetical protein